MLSMRIAALTHVGLRRDKNEDCIAIGSLAISDSMPEPWVALHPLDQPFVCLVADGMGGHPAGEVASRLAAEHVAAGFAAFGSNDHALIAAVQSANRALFLEMAKQPEFYGMGTTLACIVAHDDALTAINVGDSRVYAFGRGALEQLSMDHCTEVGMLSLLSRVPARVLNQCLGGFAGSGDLDPHLVRLPLEADRAFLVCSDGLHDMLSDRDIAACLSDDVAQSVRLLFERAMDEGGIDNISIIYARVEALAQEAVR